MAVEIRAVGQDKAAQKLFLKLPWDLYADDPNWVPPLLMQIKEMVGFRPGPFYERNACESFVAIDSGRVVGRVTAIENVGHNERYSEKRGFFGFFDCVDSQEVATELLTAAGSWLKQRGLEDLRGPANPSLNHEVGLLVDGFGSPPTFMMTYNPPYYERLLTDFGFEKCQDMYAFEGHIDMIAGLDPKLEFVIKEIKRRFNVNVRPFDPKRFDEEVGLFLDIYNKSLVGTWGFVPLSDAEVASQAKGLKHLLVPELTTIIEVDGRPIGAGLGLLDFNPVIKKIGGRLFPFGFIALLRSKRKLKRVRLMSTNVLPEFQKWGFGLLALEGMLPHIMDLGITQGEFSWVLESNHLSRASLERGGLERSKTYRMFDRTLADIN
ncbi:MAG TPA: N-acetyltransferase [Planctomycetaceae bacterium]|nr:N-acetyltransferase [Planctomycetaceae bacterium]